jgi:hypothetical protein
MAREENMFRIQFLHLSPHGRTTPMEETAILGEDLASVTLALSRLRPWPCDADAFRIIDEDGHEVLAGTKAWQAPALENFAMK